MGQTALFAVWERLLRAYSRRSHGSKPWWGDGKSLSGEDDGGGDGAVFGDEDVESSAQGAVVHDFETDSLLAEQGVYLWIRKQLLLAGAEQYDCRLRFEYRRQVFGVQLL